MIITIFVCLFVTVTESVEKPLELQPNDRILVKLDPDQVVAAFRSVVSSDYMRNLAKDLAFKVAENYLVQMKQTPPKPLSIRENAPREPTYPQNAPPSANAAEAIKDEVMQAIESTPPKEHIQPGDTQTDLNTSIIDVKQAMTLLKEPSPDGDNLDFMVSPNLSEDEETKAKKKGTQVVQLMKVNGKYYRRVLGVV